MEIRLVSLGLHCFLRFSSAGLIVVLGLGCRYKNKPSGRILSSPCHTRARIHLDLSPGGVDAFFNTSLPLINGARCAYTVRNSSPQPEASLREMKCAMTVWM